MAIDWRCAQLMTRRITARLLSAIPKLGILPALQSFSNLRSFLRLRPAAFGMTVVLGAGLLVAELVGIGVLVPLITIGYGQHEGGNILAGVPLLSTIESHLQRFGPAQRLLVIGVIVAAVGVVRAALQFWRTYLYFWTMYRVMQDIHGLCYRQFTRLSLSRVLSADAGTFVNLIVTYPREVAVALVSLSALTVGLLQFGTYLVVILALSWKMGLFAVLTLGVAVLFVGAVLMTRIAASGEVLNDRSVAFHQWIMETIKGRSVIDGLGLTDFSHRRFVERSNRFFSAIAARERLKALTEPVVGAFVFLVIAGVLISVALGPGELGVKVPQITLFVICLTRLLTPLSVINTAFTDIRANSNSILRVRDFLEESGRTPSRGERFPGLSQSLEVESVSFTYPGARVPALRDVSFAVGSKQMVALVGPSGAGKSSIVNLMLRFFEPTSGTIQADGVDIRRYSEDSWLQHVAFVPQEAFLFNETIEANIRFGLDTCDHQSVVKAARLAHAHEFIMAQPEGYATLVGENGARLSGGQKQRIAIARAVLRAPQVLILDEATSHLDSESERAIQAALLDLRQRCALLVVAHRLSTVTSANEIMVMDKGRIVERGTHAELLAREALYAHLWTLQISHSRLEVSLGAGA